MPHEYDFAERLEMSQGICAEKSIEFILLKNIPGATRVERAEKRDDRNGTDYWVHHSRGKPYSVDVKNREEDYSMKPGRNAADDLALETWSVVEARSVGWTRNESKMTDYILWYWQDSGRWCLVPFAMLCGVFQEFWRQWRKEFQTNVQKSYKGAQQWHSECVFVPRHLVWESIYQRYAGTTFNELKSKRRRTKDPAALGIDGVRENRQPSMT
jgi:hypothetical protein